ncbi:MarR family winged helix-turn-helix transcriptional regulator [Carnobacterium jeotgali]|uniref:MarR family winged helix-turn-helix transcriptional regulator n=1 Tax=Carnobacterium jeotgali TaxID=545534 RepID=UPI00388D4047
MNDTEKALKTLTVLLKSSSSVQDVVKKDMTKYGVNPTEFSVLELLYNKGDQPIQYIGKKILLASSSITYVVDKLEKKEFIKRTPSATDRRVTNISISEKGTVFMQATFPQHEKLISNLFDVLSEEEKTTLITLLKKVGYHASTFK